MSSYLQFISLFNEKLKYLIEISKGLQSAFIKGSNSFMNQIL